jgi:hypothetical protein
LTDNYSDQEFEPIAAAMKELPYFSPSPQFADKVMARVRISGAAQVPAVFEAAPARPLRRSSPAPVYASVDRRLSPSADRSDLRRSIPARIAAVALVTSVSVTMAAVALVTMFNFDIFLLVSRVFGPSTMSFLAALATDVSATASGTAASAAASAGTATGLAVMGSFAAGAVAATAALRAAASASRRAA